MSEYTIENKKLYSEKSPKRLIKKETNIEIIKNIKSTNYSINNFSKRYNSRRRSYNTANEIRAKSNHNLLKTLQKKNHKELYEESLLNICVLGMENDRLLNLTRKLTSELNEQKKTVEEYHNLLELKESDITKRNIFDNDKRKLKKEIEALNEILEDKNNKNEDLRKKINDYEIELNKLRIFKKDNSNIIKENYELKENLEVISRERDEIFKENDNLRNNQEITNNESYNKIIELKDHLKLIAGENDRLILTLEERDDQIDKIEIKCEKSITSFNALNKDYDFLKIQYENLYKDHDSLLRKYEDCEQDRENLQNKLEQISQEYQELKYQEYQ